MSGPSDKINPYCQIAIWVCVAQFQVLIGELYQAVVSVDATMEAVQLILGPE